MYYTVYKITNKINNKIYIGVHKTDNLDDGYMGSGKVLKRAQEKYGIENFKKEILKVFDNPEDMFSMESVLVNEDFVKRKDTYNLKEGGFGGFDYINENGLSLKNNYVFSAEDRAKSHKKQKWLIENDPEWFECRNKKFSETMKRKFENGYKGSFKGKKHTEETKKKISEANSIKQEGSRNSQFGTVWVYKLEDKKSIKIKKGRTSRL